MERYNHKDIEAKWQARWDKDKTFFVSDKALGDKAYILDMFPYPSAQGLHVGHPEGYTATDIYCRYLRLTGIHVLHPMGWDAFGLPAENYAIKTGRHPREVTWQNIDNFRRQIKSLGFSYDWDREVNTADPSYYQWTEWLFLKLYEKGLAYRKTAPVNWCPSCQTVLANEQVVSGACERCSSQVEQRQMAQWFFKITSYADRLLNDLSELDWPEPIKEMQKNWIGKSEGTLVKFPISNFQFPIEIFTTRLDTIFGATYLVLAPEHEAISKLQSQIKNWSEVAVYIEAAQKKTELERKIEVKDKTGVKLDGVAAVNPATGEEIPVFVADYVLIGYGTGAIMAVPVHDERDYEFAKKYELPVKHVIAPYFKTTQGKDAVHENEPVVCRRTVNCLVKHWSEDKYLCLDWEEYDWRSGIIGGVEEGEDEDQAAVREIAEETGYTNLRLLKKWPGEIHSRFFATHKNEDRYSIGYYYLFDLVDGSSLPTAAEHIQNHKSVWVEGSKMASWLNLNNFRFFWEKLQSNNECFGEEGVLINSSQFSGLTSREAIPKIAEKIGAKLTTEYRLRDWLISRQRYWGAPIPIIYCDKCGEVPVPEADLPVELPGDVDFRPTGESPLARSESFHKVKCPKCAGAARRESDTMDTFVDSAWYFLRYADPHNVAEAFAKEKIKNWLPVDFYVGGAEHAVMHLLYARFITKVLSDLGYVDFVEPFSKLRNQGLILGEDGQKMSKSRGNVVNPDDIVAEYGADTFRLYEMFLGPLEDVKPWNTASIIGLRRFLEKVWNLTLSLQVTAETETTSGSDINYQRLAAQTIKKVTDDIKAFRFNTAISALMKLINDLALNPALDVAKDRAIAVRTLLILLYPFAPHITAELWSKAGVFWDGYFPAEAGKQIWQVAWPAYAEQDLAVDFITLTVQVNGRMRASVNCPSAASESDLVELAKNNSAVAKHLAGKSVRRVIYVAGKLINLVTD